jgi:hypothetical protein
MKETVLGLSVDSLARAKTAAPINRGRQNPQQWQAVVPMKVLVQLTRSAWTNLVNLIFAGKTRNWTEVHREVPMAGGKVISAPTSPPSTRL